MARPATHPPTPPRSAKHILAFVTVYVLIQQLVPLFVRLTSDDIEPRDFSWDMFGAKVECTELAAYTVLPDGRKKQLNLEQAFPKWSHLRRLLSEQRLQKFADYVCAGMEQKHGARRTLHLSVECRNMGSEQQVRLAAPERDWCLAAEQAPP